MSVVSVNPFGCITRNKRLNEAFDFTLYTYPLWGRHEWPTKRAEILKAKCKELHARLGSISSWCSQAKINRRKEENKQFREMEEALATMWTSTAAYICRVYVVLYVGVRKWAKLGTKNKNKKKRKGKQSCNHVSSPRATSKQLFCTEYLLKEISRCLEIEVPCFYLLHKRWLPLKKKFRPARKWDFLIQKDSRRLKIHSSSQIVF